MARKPYDGPPDPPPDKPPKSNAPPGPAAGDQFRISAENGRALPIVFGTVRVTPVLIERYAYAFYAGSTLPRAPSTSYAVGTVKRNFGNLYVVRSITTGITGSGDGPSGTGSGIVDGGVTWDYIQYGFRHLMAVALCEGQINGAGKAWQDKNNFAAYTDLSHDSNYFELHLGTPTETRASSGFWPTDGVTLQDVYGNTAVLYGQMTSGSDADLPTVDIEVKNTSATDENPADIAIVLLTHARKGAAWPAAMVDSVSTTSANASSWWNYCKAAGFLISWNIDSQQSARSLLKMLLAVSNTDAVWTNRADGSGGMLKFVPLGTDSITAGGATFTPNLTPAFALTPDDFLEPIEVDTIPGTETYNSMPIEYIDRATDYKRITVTDNVMEDVDVRGLVRANTTAIPMVMSPEAAIQLSRIRAQQSLNVANTWRMRVGYRFLLVEPTDLLTDTDGLIGVNAQPVRVTVFEEDQSGDGSIFLEAEDFPAAVGAAAFYSPQTNNGYKPAVATALTVLQVIPVNIPGYSVVPSQSITASIRNFHNLWPNPTSEFDPPDGISVPNDGSNAEFDFRSNVGTANAKAGRFVRVLSKTAVGAGEVVSLLLRVPATSDEHYLFQAYAKWISTGGTPIGGLYVTTRDAVFGVVTAFSGITLGTGASGWNLLSAPIAVTAGSVWLDFELRLTFGAAGTAEIRFDEILTQRSVWTTDVEDTAITTVKLYNVQNARGTRAIAQSISNATFTTVVFADDYDFFNAYNSGTGVYTVQATGKYRVSALVTLDAAGHDMTDAILTVTVNGTEAARLDRRQPDSDLAVTHYLDGMVALTGCTTLKLTVSDTVEIKVRQVNASAGSISTEALAISNWFCIEELPGVKFNF